MKLKSLQLINFRNYEDLKITPSETLNLFIGKNAQGKTNLIESIAVSISGSSFRTTKNTEMIKLGKKSSNIISEIEKKGRVEKRSIYIDSSGMKHSINNKITTLKDFTKNSAAVIFKPDDLYIIKNYVNVDEGDDKAAITGALASITEGDVSVTYKDNTSSDKILNAKALVGSLMSGYRAYLTRYRKIAW